MKEKRFVYIFSNYVLLTLCMAGTAFSLYVRDYPAAGYAATATILAVNKILLSRECRELKEEVKQ